MWRRRPVGDGVILQYEVKILLVALFLLAALSRSPNSAGGWMSEQYKKRYVVLPWSAEPS